jgi:hypothetical protein
MMAEDQKYADARKAYHTMRAPLTTVATTVLALSAQAQEVRTEAVLVGPWSISTSYKANRFEDCTMSRTAGDLNASFVMTRDGLLLQLESVKWQLDRGKAYPVRLFVGSKSYDAKASAETKIVTIALADRSLNEAIKMGNFLDVQGEGATMRIPLDKSSAAFDRLNVCFDKNVHAGAETNPFVSPIRRP